MMKNERLNELTKTALLTSCDHDIEQAHDPRVPWGYEAWRCKKCDHTFHLPGGKMKGGPIESDPDRPYCKDDQSCCDFICGN